MKSAALDSNVLLRAAGRPQSAAATLLLLRDRFATCASESTVAEFEVVSRRAAVRAKLPGITTEAVASLSQRLRDGIFVAYPPPVFVCRDPNDDKFIACALATGAEYIVTYDKDLLVLDGYQGLKIMTPEDFLRVLTDEPLDDEGNSQV